MSEEETQTETEEKKEVTLEQLPVHVLRSKLKEQDIKFKNTDKKSDLIKMIKAGKTIHEKREVQRRPTLQESKTETSLPVVPKEIREQLEAMASKGLKWEIDEKSCCITFTGVHTRCTTLDQSARNILNAAKQATRRGAAPIEKGNRPSGEPLGW